jgi:hypothetical protein
MVLDNPSSGIINIEFINAFNCSKLVGYSVLQEFVGYLKSQERDGLPTPPLHKKNTLHFCFEVFKEQRYCKNNSVKANTKLASNLGLGYLKSEDIVRVTFSST